MPDLALGITQAQSAGLTCAIPLGITQAEGGVLDAAKTQLNLLMTMSTKLSDDMVRSRDLRYGVPYIRWPFVRGVCARRS